MSDKKTTIHGILTAIGILCVGVAAVIDGDPATVMDTQGVVAAVGMILAAFGVTLGGIASKDK